MAESPTPDPIDSPPPRFNPVAADPLPRRFTRRGWIILGAVLGLFAICWIAVFATYNVAGTAPSDDQEIVVPESGIAVFVQPVRFEPGDNLMTARLQFQATGDLEQADGSLSEDVVVSVVSDSGVAEVTLPKGRQLASQEVKLGSLGNYATYPLDSYKIEFGMVADAVIRGPGGQLTEKQSIPLAAQVSGSVDGWDLVVPNITVEPADYVEGTIGLDRSGNTLLFAFFLLGLMVVLVVLALVVAVLTFTNRRRIEVDLLGWFAALLFALPFLRQILPGAPPVGAAIDVYIFLWLLGLAMISAVLVVLGWLSQNKAELLKQHSSS